MTNSAVAVLQVLRSNTFSCEGEQLEKSTQHLPNNHTTAEGVQPDLHSHILSAAQSMLKSVLNCVFLGGGENERPVIRYRECEQHLCEHWHRNCCVWVVSGGRLQFILNGIQS